MLKFAGSAGEVFQRQGSCVVTKNGLEGSLIYAASALIRDEITIRGSATIALDLAPDRSLEELIRRLSIPRRSRTISSHLRSKVNIKGVETGLLREFAADALDDATRLAHAIKDLPIPITAARPIAESISTCGRSSFRVTQRIDDGEIATRHVLRRRNAGLGGSHGRIPADCLFRKRPSRWAGCTAMDQSQIGPVDYDRNRSS